MKSKTAFAIQLFPQKLGEASGVLKILTIDRKPSPPVYNSIDISPKSLLDAFPFLPSVNGSHFRSFGAEGMKVTIEDIKRAFDSQQTEPRFGTFFRKSLFSHYYKLFRSVRASFDQVTWYHSVSRGDSKRLVTLRCRMNPAFPQLNFRVVKNDHKFELEGIVEIKGRAFNLNDFRRHQFFIERDDEYFLLYFRDYETLDWLKDQSDRFLGSPEKLLKQVIIPLEKKGYKVDRQLLKSSETISTEPLPAVFLSELSGSFLMLTPQWFYDGYKVEGEWQEKTIIEKKDRQIHILRNQEKEDELRHMLKSLHPNFPNQKRDFYYLSFADAQKKQWFAKSYHKLLTSGIDLIGMDMLLHFRYSQDLPATELILKEEFGDRVVFNITVKFGNEKVPLSELQKILWAGQRTVLLKDGSLGILPDAWMEEFGILIKHGKVSGANGILVSQGLVLTTVSSREKQAEVPDNPDPKRNWWLQYQRWFEGGKLYSLPELIRIEPRDYQFKGYQWMRLLSELGMGGCLADDMGLGKTLQAICFLGSVMEKIPAMKSLVICPASLIYNWQQELEKFAPALTSAVYHGSQRDTSVLSDSEVRVVITSYGTFRSDVEQLTEPYFDVVIIDESHNIKNPSAKITRAVSLLKAGSRFVLSGTPVINNTFDLYAQMTTVMPGILGSREFFKREYADPIDRFGDPDKTKNLQKLIAPFVLRRTKDQVAKDLPEKTETVLWCEMGAGQREFYNDTLQRIRGQILEGIRDRGLAQSKLNVLEGITRLRQICNAPSLIGEGAPSLAESIKTEVLFNELEQILEAHKVLVFSQFTGMLDLIAAACIEKEIEYYHFDGQTAPAKRMEMVNAFQETDNPVRLFLISLKAGNAGINLTAADYVFLVDPWWNEAVQQQAIDRTHRIGQDKNVFAYKMVCKDSIEEKILTLQERKKKLASDLISPNEDFIKGLELEDVQWLFE
jgi:superfamily II DNA or RNA helicase